MRSFRYIIIGNSAAGIAAYEGIRQKDRAGSVAMISDETAPIYSRSLISYFLAGQIDEEGMLFRPRSFYGREGIEALLGRKVVKVDPKAHQVMLEDGEVFGYEKLLIGTGSAAVHPDIPGGGLNGCFVFRSYEDAKAIKAYLPKVKEAVVLGGGPVGIKAAEALSSRKIRVTLIVSSGNLLSQILDGTTASVIQKMLEDHNVKVITRCDVGQVLGESSVTGTKLADGRVIPCQMVVFCKGVQANTGLAVEAGISVRKGIVVDDHMRSSIPDIYAAGDVAEVKDILTGQRTIHALWPNAMQQGYVAGMNMAGGDRSYDGGFGMNAINIFGTPIIAMGLLRPEVRGGAEVLTAKGNGWYRSLVVRDDRLIGAFLVGEIDSAGVLNHMITHKIGIHGLEEAALRPDFSPARLAEAGIEIDIGE
ncbi:MAG: Coenzyme A disulfide reductase [Methanomassiliicoccales archaeon PtaU1.Bin124]|nr:MAG: Coenzyme A disulfide reductase [Methanomassiliicoccales archaeon PtaU1.Bin124]